MTIHYILWYVNPFQQYKPSFATYKYEDRTEALSSMRKLNQVRVPGIHTYFLRKVYAD